MFCLLKVMVFFFPLKLWNGNSATVEIPDIAFLTLITSNKLACFVHLFQFSSVAQCVRHFVSLWTSAGHASLSITNSCSLLRFMSIKSVMPYNHLILCHPLLLLPSILPSIRVFSSESVLCIRWTKDWSFSLSISPMNTRDWSPLGWTGWISLQPKGLSRVFQQHSSKASII